MTIKYLLIITVAMVFSACGIITDIDQNGHYKVGNPYSIYGVRYYPKEDYTYSEVGMASWYGPNFHGKKTANGAIFNQHGYTAAHRTLPMPSLVRVRNLQNGRTIVVKINDRGPYTKQRIIDLSYASAKYLDVIRNGVARVQVEILPEQSKMLKQAMLDNRPMPKFDKNGNLVNGDSVTRTNSIKTVKNAKIIAIPSGYYVQVGVYSDLNTALQSKKMVQSFGHTEVYQTTLNNMLAYAVRLGPYNMKLKAETLSLILQQREIPTIIKKF